mgnify:CR=1 FL=1
MYYIQDSFAYVTLLRERLPMLFTELASFAYTCNLLLSKGRESDDDSFDLHAFHLLEIDVADPFVP